MTFVDKNDPELVDRRTALTKGLVAGAAAGVVWSAPKIQGLSLRPRYAAAASSAGGVVDIVIPPFDPLVAFTGTPITIGAGVGTFFYENDPLGLLFGVPGFGFTVVVPGSVLSNSSLVLSVMTTPAAFFPFGTLIPPLLGEGIVIIDNPGEFQVGFAISTAVVGPVSITVTVDCTV